MNTIKKYPYVKQKGLKECGPTCVQMILKYYHGYVSINKLSEMMNTNQNGTSAYHMKETLKKLGFNSNGIKTSNLLTLKLPCIAHVIINHSYNHYVVIYKVNKNKQTLLIADPAKSIKQISFKEFKQIWSGVAIQMYPIKPIIKEKEPNVLKFIWYYIKQNLKLILLLNLTSLVIYFISIISSLFLPIVITNLNTQIIFNLSIFFLIIFVSQNLLNFIKDKLMLNLNLKLDQQLTTDIFGRILNLPYRYYRRKTTGEITSYFNDLYIVKTTIYYCSQIILIDLPILLILSIIISSFNFLFAIILIVNTFLYFLLSKLTNHLLIEEMTRQKYQVSSYITESISGFETIKNLNIKSKIYNKFLTHYTHFLDISKKVYRQNNIISLLKSLVDSFTIIILVILIIINHYDVNHLIIIYIITTTTLNIIKKIFDFEYQLDELKSSLISIEELKNYKQKKLSKSFADGDIKITNLKFTYDKNTPILKNINLIIKKSSKVLVTGSSGSGKTTLFKILKGYYKDYQGNITIGKINIKNYTFKDIIYVSSKEILFTGTLIDNLTLKNNNPQSIHICEIENIAKNNYYQLIEENGFNLSSGQKQRIVLARALNNFNILIIDEGLNQVSVDMERRILKKLFTKYQNKTIIYISHRLDNLDLFDQLIKIKKGKVVLNTKRNN